MHRVVKRRGKTPFFSLLSTLIMRDCSSETRSAHLTSAPSLYAHAGKNKSKHRQTEDTHKQNTSTHTKTTMTTPRMHLPPALPAIDVAASDVASEPAEPAQAAGRYRRVSFGTADIVAHLLPSSAMTEEDRNELWYPLGELDALKEEARDLCRQIRDDGPAANTEESRRGLEHRVCVERQRNKILALRCIIKAHRRFQNPEHVAIIARRCTAWAAEVAMVEASKDYCEAYRPGLLSMVPPVKLSPVFPFSTKKRAPSPPLAIDMPDRRVRPRTA